MFNKIFRRGKTAKEDASQSPNYKSSLKNSVPEYDNGPTHYNYNNKSSYPTIPNRISPVPNKYAASNEIPPPWSDNYNKSQYDGSTINRPQNVYTAPPQRNLPYNPVQNNKFQNAREYDKSPQQYSSAYSTHGSNAPTIKSNNVNFSTNSQPTYSAYDSKQEERSPYITLASTYSQNRTPHHEPFRRDGSVSRNSNSQPGTPHHEPFRRDGSVSRNSNSQPGTPTATRREIYDSNPYFNRTAFRSTPNRTFESPQRDPGLSRPAFSPPSNNRFGSTTYESPVRENINDKNINSPYRNFANYQSKETPNRSSMSTYHQPANLKSPEFYKFNPSRVTDNIIKPEKNIYSNDKSSSIYDPNPIFNSNNTTPSNPEPGKYVPFAIRKALKESQEVNKNDNRNTQNTTSLGNINNKPASKYTYTPYKPVYETQDVSSKLNKSPYNNNESPYVELANSSTGTSPLASTSFNMKSPSPSQYNYFNEPPQLPPKSSFSRNRQLDSNNTSSTPPSKSYYNLETNEIKDPINSQSNKTIYSPPLISPRSSQDDYISLAVHPKPYSVPHPWNEKTHKNVYGTYNRTIPETDNVNASQFDKFYTNPSDKNNSNTKINNPFTASSMNSPYPCKDTTTDFNSTITPGKTFVCDNQQSKNIYEPQRDLYDTNKSYVQMPQYNYRSTDETTATKTNTNAFNDWLPKNASNLNENSSYDSTRNESEQWKREKDNSKEFSLKSFGTVPSKLNASNYLDLENNLHRNNNNDSNSNKENGFDRYSTSKQQEDIFKPFASFKSRENPILLPGSNSYSIEIPQLDTTSLSNVTTNVFNPANNDLENESKTESLASSEKINETTNEISEEKPLKKTVRFFNPIDKSRDFISDIMAKGRNRGHHNKNRNNNNKTSNQKTNNKKIDSIDSSLIISNDTDSDLMDIQHETNNQNEIILNLKNINNKNYTDNNNNSNNNKNKNDLNNNNELNIKSDSENEDKFKTKLIETEGFLNDKDHSIINGIENNTNSVSNKTGYQITKSKNSRDIVNKLQNPRAKLTSPEDHENDNYFGTNEKNSTYKGKNKFDDDTTDNTDTETLDENFEDDEDLIKASKIPSKSYENEQKFMKENNELYSSSEESKHQSQKCEHQNKFSSNESFSKNLNTTNVDQQQIQQEYQQKLFSQKSSSPSVSETNIDRHNRSTVHVANTKTSFAKKDSSEKENYGNLNKEKTTKTNNKNKNAEQIENIEKLSELTECDRDNFIKTQNSMGQSQTKSPQTSVNTAPQSPRLVRSRSSSPPNKSTNKPQQLNSSDYAEIFKCSSQQDHEPLIEEPLSPTTPLSPTESCDQFYDLTHDTAGASISSNSLPKVTIADYSQDPLSSNLEPDVFYDFETITTNFNADKNLSKSPPKYPPPPPSPSAQFKSRSASPIDIATLEDIEEEEDEDEWHFIDENSTNNKILKNPSETQKEFSAKQNFLNSPTFGRKNVTTKTQQQLQQQQQQQRTSPILSRKLSSPQKINFDYDDYKDGLNTPDSGIGGASTPISTVFNSTQITATTTSSTNNSKVLVINSCDLVNDTDDIELLQSHHKNTSSNCYINSESNENSTRVNFCENNNYIENNSEYFNNSASIVIDSISLPDVVIETKPKESDSQCGSQSSDQNNSYVLNVSKSKSEGNVHFIPIHVERHEKTKIEIVEETIENVHSPIQNLTSDTFNFNDGFINDISDQNLNNDSNNDNETIFDNNNNNECYNNYNLNQTPNTQSQKDEAGEEYRNREIELIEKLKQANEEKLKKENDLKRELVSQEARFNAQLQEAQRNASSAQERAHELQMKIDQLEQDISLKSWHIERLNGEIKALQQEHSAIRKRLHTIEEEKERLRKEHFDAEDEFNIKIENLEEKYKELEEKYEKLRHLATSLQTQLASAKAEADELQIEKENLCEEKDAQLKSLQELLDKAVEERKELELKWQKEFEMLRNHNQEHEEQLLTDCEFQLRTMQKKCKEKIEAAEKAKHEALERNAELEEKVAEGKSYSERLKNLQAEVRQLRGLTNDQRESISYMHEQIEELRNDLEAANNDLESKIEEVRKIKLYCDNTLLYKDREMIQKIDVATREVATIWEEKLLTEMTRLTNELEAVHAEERLSDMNKLQSEHIEELKVLTNRYTSNEEELRRELEEVSEKLQKKTEEFLTLREKADKEILTTRIHLDKADRDYQQAMNRELARKEELEEKLRKQFEDDKAEMEANIKKRINEMKDEFKKEMANQTQDIAQRHRKQLEQQWDQLVAEKEDAIQTLEKRHKIKMEEQENRLQELLSEQGNVEAQHRRDMKELKEAYDMDRSALQNRDVHNSQEIEQLHRKCRCLTNLFEEMRLRYERREPRPEDLREIDELRARCDSQERDLCELTERLREMQIQMEEMQASTTNENQQKSSGGRKKQIRKPPPKQIPISCDVIYEEENEETESLGEDLTVLDTSVNDDNVEEHSNDLENGDFNDVQESDEEENNEE